MIKAALLRNAIDHGGKADPKVVLSKLIGSDKSILNDIDAVKKRLFAAAKELNSKNMYELEQMCKDFGIKREEKQAHKEGLKPLPDTGGKIVLRLPPEPSGYMHIGHAISFTINYLYKEKYNGFLWLRFEDTNPELVKPEFVEDFKKGIEWLGIKYDRSKFISDDMEKIYGYAEKLISNGMAYICTCDADRIKNDREKMKECGHRENTQDNNMAMWVRAKEGGMETGSAVLRFKGNMKDKDASLRDPNIMRIIKTDYKPYSVWPLYDFASVVEDEMCGVTHILRSNEFKSSLQARLRSALGFRVPTVMQYSRFNFKGTLTSKRKVRELIRQGHIKGWDDVRLATISAIRRRGIQPEAIREFVKEVGYSSSEHEYNLEMLFTFNRRIIDGKAKRFFFVPNPIRLEVKDAPHESIRLPFHPSEKLGYRDVQIDGKFFVDKADVASMKTGDAFRLKELYSVKLTAKHSDGITCEIYSKEHVEGEKIIQWVTEKNVPLKVIKIGDLLKENGEFNRDSMNEIHGIAEEGTNEIEEGQIVQFERFGFCRMDDKSRSVLIFISR